MADWWESYAYEESRRYKDTPYDRGTYLRLLQLMKPIQAATNDSHKGFKRRGMSPPPTTQGYRDKEQYLLQYAENFEMDSAAMKACAHSKNPDQCRVARAMVQGTPT